MIAMIIDFWVGPEHFIMVMYVECLRLNLCVPVQVHGQQ